METENVTESAGWSGNTTVATHGVRPGLKIVFPVFVTIYAIVGMSGVFGNLCMLATLIRRNLCSDTTFVLLANVAVADLIKTTISLPLTLYRILVETWNLGKFCCYFVAVIQSWPLYASMLTYLSISFDRHRRIAQPACKRLNSALIVCFIWLISGCASLPLILYVQYVDKDLADLPDFALLDLQYCIIFHEHQFEDYVRGLFTALYVIPLLAIVGLNWKTSAALRRRFELIRGGTRRTLFSSPYHYTGAAKSAATPDCVQRCAIHSPTQEHSTPRNSSDHSLHQEALTLERELKTQKYISLMVLVFAGCWCPLHILHAFYVLFDNVEDESEAKIDISYLMFFWLGFLSACINPLIFASWRLPQAARNRLRGYFRFSVRGETPLLPANAFPTRLLPATQVSSV